MRVRYYFDEDMDIALTAALRRRGIDILTTQEAGNLQDPDEEQLAFAAQSDCVLFSHNSGDFARLHLQWMRGGRSHSGIVISDQLPLGVLLRRLSNLWFHVAKEDMVNRLEFLGSWK